MNCKKRTYNKRTYKKRTYKKKNWSNKIIPYLCIVIHITLCLPAGVRRIQDNKKYSFVFANRVYHTVYKSQRWAKHYKITDWLPTFTHKKAMFIPGKRYILHEIILFRLKKLNFLLEWDGQFDGQKATYISKTYANVSCDPRSRCSPAISPSSPRKRTRCEKFSTWMRGKHIPPRGRSFFHWCLV